MNEQIIEIKKIEKKYPIVSDKILIDIINGISVNNNVISYQKKRNYLTKKFDQILGKDRKHQLLINETNSAIQSGIHDWILELTNALNISCPLPNKRNHLKVESYPIFIYLSKKNCYAKE